MFERLVTAFVVAAAAIVLPGCGGLDGSADLSPAEEYRERQLDEALAGVSVVDGRLVAEPAPPLSADELAGDLDAVDDLLDRGLRAAAITRAVAAVRGAPRSAEAASALGRALLTTDRTKVAVAAFAVASELAPRDVDARFLLGVAFARDGRAEDATVAWRDVLVLEPDHGAAHARLASVSWLAGDVEAAARHLVAAEAVGAAVPGQLASLVTVGEPPAASVTSGAASGEPPGRADEPVIGPQVWLHPTLGSIRANETSAAAAVPDEVVATWNDYDPDWEIRLGVAVSLDGSTWSDQVVRAPPANRSDKEGDPMTVVDPRTGTLWVGAISFDTNGGLFVARKQAGSQVFEPSVLTRASASADKGWMAAGPVPGQPDSTRVYVAYNLGLQRSEDLGDSWSAPVSLGSGVGFLPRVGPDGTIYISYWDYLDGHFLRRSYDGGLTVTSPVRITTLVDTWGIYSSPQVPGEFRVPQLASLAVDPVSGTLYCVYFDTTSVAGGDADVDLYLTRSDDGGDSWTAPVVISADPDPPGDQFFPWLEVDPSGRLHLLYYDSSLTVQPDSAASAWLDAAYAWSDDGGATWTSHRLTGASFDTNLTDLGTGQFIGDYNGLAVAGDRAWPVYLSTELGAPGIYSHEIAFDGAVFADDFEYGNLSAWSQSLP